MFNANTILCCLLGLLCVCKIDVITWIRVFRSVVYACVIYNLKYQEHRNMDNVNV